MGSPKEGSRTTREGILISTAMDWCWVDGKPIPFRVSARQAMGASTAGTVRLTGQAAHVRGSLILSCQGDEAGVGGGVVSGTRGGVCEPKTFSSSVRFEGREAVRHDDEWWMNDRNTWGKLIYLVDAQEYPLGASDGDGWGIEWNSPPSRDVTATRSREEASPATPPASRLCPPVEALRREGGLRVSAYGQRSRLDRTKNQGRGEPPSPLIMPPSANDGQVAVSANGVTVRADAIGSALSGEVASNINASPTLRQQLTQLAADGWRIHVSPVPESGSATRKNDRLIILGQIHLESPEDTLRTLAHEIGHAMSPRRDDWTSREAFINSKLLDEGEAEFNTMVVQRELIQFSNMDIRN